MTLKDRLLDVFLNHRGRERALTRRQLRLHINLPDRLIRDAISELRLEGFPIVSLDKGYFWASSEDLKSYIKRERHRALSILQTVRKLEKDRTLEDDLEQLDLF